MPIALVTGATAGIGAAFARRLARAGYDLVLVARDTTRLEAVAAGLRPAVKVEVLTADLTDPEQLRVVEARLADAVHPVEVLVNNAGIPAGGAFLDTTADAEERMLRLNVLAVLRLSKAAADAMARRHRGAIINVSSVAGFLPYGTYSAGKAWVTRFSEALAVELSGTGVRVVALCPGMVRTEFHERAGMDVSAIPAWSWLDADLVAEAGWRGVLDNRVVVVPSPLYRALVAVLRHLPPRLTLATARATRARRPPPAARK